MPKLPLFLLYVQELLLTASKTNLGNVKITWQGMIRYGTLQAAGPSVVKDLDKLLASHLLAFVVVAKCPNGTRLRNPNLCVIAER